MLKLVVHPALAEPVGFTLLPDGETTPVVLVVGGRAVEVAGDLAGDSEGESTPSVVLAGGRADGATEVAGELALLVVAGLGDEAAVT